MGEDLEEAFTLYSKLLVATVKAACEKGTVSEADFKAAVAALFGCGNLDVRAFAKKIDYSPGTAYRWLNGDTASPRTRRNDILLTIVAHLEERIAARDTSLLRALPFPHPQV